MAIVGKDGQDSTEVFSGDTRVWGVVSDLDIVKEMSIETVPDEIMRFTPDGLPVDVKPPKGVVGVPPDPAAGARTISRLTRNTLNLDKMYFTQTYWDPTGPRAFSRADEYHANTGKPDDTGLNPARIGAIGKGTDIFRVSIAKNIDKIVAPPASGSGTKPSDALTEEWEKRSSYNDYLGSYPGRKDLIFGRVEIRCTTHFYLNDRKTAPLAFTLTEWPRDENPKDESETPLPVFPFGVSREIFINQQLVESQTVFKLEGDPDHPEAPPSKKPYPGLAGQILTGALALDKANHAFGVLVSLPRYSTCNVTNTELSDATRKDFFPGLHDPATIDDRIIAFSSYVCTTPELLSIDCSTTKQTGFIPCIEIGAQSYNERWITITDRFNSMLAEIDRLYCITKGLNIKINTHVDISKGLYDVLKKLVDHLIASSIPSAGDAGMITIKSSLTPSVTKAFKFELPTICTGA